MSVLTFFHNLEHMSLAWNIQYHFCLQLLKRVKTNMVLHSFTVHLSNCFQTYLILEKMRYRFRNKFCALAVKIVLIVRQLKNLQQKI